MDTFLVEFSSPGSRSSSKVSVDEAPSSATSFPRLGWYARPCTGVMAMNRIWFLPGMSLSQFLELYGTEE
jgi:hypothetical protein